MTLPPESLSSATKERERGKTVTCATKQKASRILAAVYGLLFAASILLGRKLDQHADSALLSAVLFLGCALGAGGVFFCLDAVFPRLLAKRKVRPGKRLSSRAAFLISFGVLALSRVPYWLAYWPSMFNYDVTAELVQWQQQSFFNQYPFIHTLLEGLCYDLGGALGSRGLGMAVYEAIQILASSACISYFIRWAYHRYRLSAWSYALMLLFFSAFPVVSIMTLSTTKDGLFAALSLLQATLFMENFETRTKTSKRALLALAAASAGMLLFRVNAVYAYIVMGVAVLAFALRRRAAYRRALAYVLCALALFAGAQGVFSTAVAMHEGPVCEALSIPIQQMARTIRDHWRDMDDDLREDSEPFMPRRVTEEYNPARADRMKVQIGWMKKEHLPAFADIWWRLGKRFPGEYAVAALYTTEGFWYAGDTSYANTSDARNWNFGCLGMWDGRSEEYGIAQSSLLPGFQHWLRRMFAWNDYVKCPALRVLCAPALYNWLLLAAVLILLRRRERMRLTLGLFYIAYMATLLLGAACLVRYEYPYMLLAPFLLLWILFPAPKPAAIRPGDGAEKPMPD